MRCELRENERLKGHTANQCAPLLLTVVASPRRHGGRVSGVALADHEPGARRPEAPNPVSTTSVARRHVSVLRRDVPSENSEHAVSVQRAL